MKLPSGLSLYDIEPKKITVNAIPTKIISLPVKVQTTGQLPHIYKLVSVLPNPSKLKLIVPEEGNHLPKFIYTEPVDLSKINKSTNIQSQVLVPQKYKLPPDEDGEVSIELNIKKR